MENALPAKLFFFLKSKECQLSCICWLQLSWCHLERKVNPQWLNMWTSGVRTAHTAHYRNIRLRHLLNTAGEETELKSQCRKFNLKSSSTLKKEQKEKERKNPFSRNRIISWILCSKSCSKAWCFLECQKPSQDVQISSSVLIYIGLSCPYNTTSQGHNLLN